MIHVATVHHLTPKWIDIQLSYLRQHIDEPFRTVANLDGIDASHHAKFDCVVPGLAEHSGKLNLLASVVCARADDDDLLMFLDGDAFPIAALMSPVRDLLRTADLVAVRRSENFGDRQPHPIFCVTTVRTWKRLRGDWSPGHPWTNDKGFLVTDIGGNLLFRLEQTATPWSPVLRSNRHNPHPVFHGVYGGLVYHHGAGFRSRWTRWDAYRTPPRTLPGVAVRPTVLRAALRHAVSLRKHVWLRRLNRQSLQLGERVMRQAATDPDFYRQFL